MSLIGTNVARLEVVLQAEENLYLRLKSLLRREESELIGLDAEVIESTVEAKRAIAEEARLLEESRRVLTDELGTSLGLAGDDLKLGVLLTHLGEEAAQLPTLHARLKALIGTTQALLEANESFANRSLTRVQETLRMLGRAAPEEVGYGPAANRSSSMGRGRLVRQAI